MPDAASLITAATGLVVGLLSLWLSLRKASDDRQASLIDDLEERTKTLTTQVNIANYELRSTLDYVVVLRAQLLEAGHDPAPWPDHMTGR